MSAVLDPSQRPPAPSADFRPCALVPTYNNPQTVRAVVERLRHHIDDVLVVDDGGSVEARAACAALATEGLAQVHHRPVNGGKGAAVKTGFRLLAEAGYTHALQVDADGQHDISQAPAFMERAAQDPAAFVIGYPVYDETLPRVRRIARRFTHFWVNLEVGRKRTIKDAMVGFRVYPIAAALAADARGDRMDFDIEVAVRLAWSGAPLVNLPVGVRYPTAEEGGVSHFQPLRDNLRFAWLHSKLCTIGVFRWLGRLVGIGK